MLIETEHAVVGVECCWTQRPQWQSVKAWEVYPCAIGGLLVATLAAIEQEDLREVAPNKVSVDLIIGTIWCIEPDRHVLVPSLIRLCPTNQEFSGARRVVGECARVIVLDLVIVSGDEPRAARVVPLELGIGPVEAVAVPVGSQIEDLPTCVAPLGPGW